MPTTIHDTYRSEDRSLVLRWLRDPILMPMVRRLPPRLTPNQLTLFGHGCMWACAAFAIVVPHRGRLVLLVLAFGYSVFNLADTLDGLYARDSGQTSRLGELYDHGLDPMSLGLVLLTYGIAMREPPALIIASTAIVAFLQFLTYLHGYRIGYVLLGEIGIVEGILIATAVCLAGVAGWQSPLMAPVWLGLSTASLVAVAVIAGALPAFVSMRGLLDYPGDVVPLIVLQGIAFVWYGVGDLGVIAASLLILAITVLQSMTVITSRLRRIPLALDDIPLTLALAVAALASYAFAIDRQWQHTVVAVLTLYALGRATQLLSRTIADERPRSITRV